LRLLVLWRALNFQARVRPEGIGSPRGPGASMSILTYGADLAQRFIAETPAKLWFGCFALGIALETIFGISASRPSVRQYLTNIAHSVVYLGAIFLFAPSVWFLITMIRDAAGFRGLINLNFLDQSTYLNQLATAALYLFVLDLFQYWSHRAQHRFSFLWDQHVVHHSDEAMNVTTAARHHWTEFMLQAFTVSLPFSWLFDITMAQTGVVAVLVSSLQFYLHSNSRIGLGTLSWLVGTPQYHRMHHSILPEHLHTNFAVYFPIWDVVFGTYTPPGKREFPPTGVAGVRLESALSISMHPFRMWVRRLFPQSV
jgi:sterol desaturase/sphingolipid hydroxylase (fatty acid hydroxylase superfamily)